MRYLCIFCTALAWALATAAPVAAQSKARPPKTVNDEPVPGYKYRELDGFRLLVNVKVVEEDEHSTDKVKPLQAVDMELTMMVRDLPPKAVAVLRTIPIWLEWETARDDESRFGVTVAVYHPGNTLTQRYRYDTLEKAVKSNCVEVVNTRRLTQIHQRGRNDCILLHEVTHAVHHHLFSYDNPHIKAAHANAMSKQLYADKYASVNEKEYFAEISCAYFNHLEYKPHTRAELKEHDPTGYHLMELTWGTPEEIEKAQKPELEKTAGAKLSLARKLSADKKRTADAIAMLESVVRDFPDTRSAGEAEKLLKKLRP